MLFSRALPSSVSVAQISATSAFLNPDLSPQLSGSVEFRVPPHICLICRCPLSPPPRFSTAGWVSVGPDPQSLHCPVAESHSLTPTCPSLLLQSPHEKAVHERLVSCWVKGQHRGASNIATKCLLAERHLEMGPFSGDCFLFFFFG